MSAEKAGVLKACPFCGCDQMSIQPKKMSARNSIYYVVCAECEAESGSYESTGDAIEAWNRRAALPDVEPVAWQGRSKGYPDRREWRAWREITGRDLEQHRDWARTTPEFFEVRPLFTHPASEGCPTQFDMVAHLARQAAWSEKTFGPGARTAGVVDHIRKELLEIEADPGDLKEWIDVTILALDGAWRSGASPAEIIAAIAAKQTKNEGRAWPDWRTADPDKAIEHDRTGEAA